MAWLIWVRAWVKSLKHIKHGIGESLALLFIALWVVHHEILELLPVTREVLLNQQLTLGAVKHTLKAVFCEILGHVPVIRIDLSERFNSSWDAEDGTCLFILFAVTIFGAVHNMYHLIIKGRTPGPLVHSLHHTVAELNHFLKRAKGEHHILINVVGSGGRCWISLSKVYMLIDCTSW